MAEQQEFQAPVIKRALIPEENSASENSVSAGEQTAVENQSGASLFRSFVQGASLSLPHLHLAGALGNEVWGVARDAAILKEDALFNFSPSASVDEMFRRLSSAGDVNAVNPNNKEKTDRDDRIRVRRAGPNAMPNAQPEGFPNAYPDEFPNAYPGAYDEAHPNAYLDKRISDFWKKKESLKNKESGDKTESGDEPSVYEQLEEQVSKTRSWWLKYMKTMRPRDL